MVHDPVVALETLISLGFERVLTSGCDSSALEGLSLIKRLAEQVSVPAASLFTMAASWALRGGHSFVVVLISNGTSGNSCLLSLSGLLSVCSHKSVCDEPWSLPQQRLVELFFLAVWEKDSGSWFQQLV